MAILDFKEVPQANSSSGEQDTFELLSRDFLSYLGYKIESHPDRGADGGKDLIVSEIRKGIGGETNVRWLVSCKHFAHSGRSVGISDEQDIRDRIEQHHCDGFMGIYSTIFSNGLSEKIKSIKENIVYDRSSIEKLLLETSSGVHLAKRYFPISIGNWILSDSAFRTNQLTTISGIRYRESESEEVFTGIFGVLLMENDVEALFFKFRENDDIAELYCRSTNSVRHLLNFELSDIDCVQLSDGYSPDLWTYYDAKDNREEFGILKFQYANGESNVISLYKINYTKCELLRVKLREFLGDWDSLAEG